MKAVMCRSFGPPSNLAIEDVPEPEVRKGEILLNIAATSLNFFDTLIIQDKYQVKPTLPFSPGAEFSGTVAALGEGVEGFAIGDRVMASAGWGGAAEKISVSAKQVTKIPDAVDFDSAAGLIIAYGTTLHALKNRGELKAGETLVVLGASGGVGLAAVEIGHIMGAKVIACASSEEKLAKCRDHGADVTINYSEGSLKEKLKEATGGKGADVVYDPVGGDFAEEALRATAWEGRFLVIGFAAGDIPKIPLNIPLLKGFDIRGVYWGRWTQMNPQGNRENNQQLLDWCAEGKLRIPIHGVYSLDQTIEALEAFQRREVVGKVIIHP